MVIALVAMFHLWPLAAPAQTSGSQPATHMDPADFVDAIVREGFDAADVVVDGDVNLHHVREVDRLLRCRACTIRGSLRAVDVVFDRVVDLSGVRVHGDLDLHGASFRDVVTLSSVSGRHTEIDGRTDLGLATFEGLTALDRVVFSGPVNAAHTTMKSTLSMSNAQFLAPATFEHARMSDAAIFSNAVFSDTATFDVATFGGAAMFRRAAFNDDVSFRAADFSGRLDFSLSSFGGPAVFDDVVLEGPGTFRGINAADRMTWDQSFAQTLDFEDSSFAAGASFAGLATTGVLSLQGVTVIPESGLRMGSVNLADILLDVDLVGSIAGRTVRADVLERLERTAELQGDLALANDARFALLATRNEANFGLGRWLDAVFYREIGGYLVRPLRPLLTLTALVLMAGFVRAVTRADRPLHLWDPTRWEEGRNGRRRPSRPAVWAATGAVVAGIRDAAHQVFRVPLRPADDGDGTPSLRSTLLAAESGVYKVLLAVALIAVSNSSATLREVIDAVRG